MLAACTSTPATVLDMRVAVENPRYGDSDPVDWPSYKPWQYPIHGIDVSRYQGQINWQQTKRGGVAFAFIKATEGGDHLDKNFRANWYGAGKAGIPRAAYHFFYFCRPAYQQANWFKRKVPKDPKALPPVLDVEWNNSSKTCKTRPSPAKVRSEMKVFLNMMERHYGKKPLIYTTVDFYKDNNLASFTGYEYWLRSVADHPSQVYPNQRWTFWQYTGTGKIPGIKGDTDINVFAGTTEQWQTWVSNRTKE